MSLVLTRGSVPAGSVPNNAHLFPIRIVAASGTEGVPSEIFVYHRPPLSAPDDSSADIFEAVASASQVEELGLEPVEADEENEVESVPFYRSDTCLFYCRTPAEAQDLWERIKEDAEDLVENIRAAAGLSVGEEHEIP
jgi:hypothetical protein